ncbi:MAG: hypothetical protein AAB380_07410 [Verrucomicrobiota bacterium]
MSLWHVNGRMSGRQGQFGSYWLWAATVLLGRPASARSASISSFRNCRQRHAALRAIALLGAHRVRVHGASVLLTGAFLLARSLETSGHVEIESGCGPDEKRQEQNANQWKVFADEFHVDVAFHFFG